jgi:hypothetical protein
MPADQDAFFLVDANELFADRVISNEYRDRLQALLPPRWIMRSSEMWLHLQPPDGDRAPTPASGFKIHVSSTPKHAHRALEIVAPHCIARAVPFKIAADPAALIFLNSKQAPRGSSGKFMTIYPASTERFASLIAELHELTQQASLEGPYILSDRRYPGSRVLYYRYGGFMLESRLGVDGRRQLQMRGHDGHLRPDVRYPYFELPPGTADPFGSSIIIADDAGKGTLLRGRYAVEGALSFSNSGGVYHATDTTTGRPVVIKEARPFTNLWSVDDFIQDSVSILEHESAVLERLAPLGVAPRLLDLFQEWEHTFLVEERVGERTLDAHWARPDLLLSPYIHLSGRQEVFLDDFVAVAQRLIAMVLAVHDANILLGDLTTRNVMIDPASSRLWIIDLESATLADDCPARIRYSTRWRTRGFSKTDRSHRDELRRDDDFHALGMTLMNGIIPINMMLELHSPSRERFRAHTIRLGLPEDVWRIIEQLEAGDPNGALTTLSQLDRHRSKRRQGSVKSVPREQPDLDDAIEAMADFIEASAEYGRDDRLWPCDTAVFLTNPLNLAYGACGPTLFLGVVGRPLSVRLIDWLTSHEVTKDDYPPGVLTGLAGIALAFATVGLVERGESVLREAYKSPLLFADAGLSHGVAGWGLVSLAFHRLTGELAHLEFATQAEEYLTRFVKSDGDTCFWPSALDGKIHYGLGQGQAGIALFLLRLYQRTGEDGHLSLARRAINYDLARGVESEVGTQWHRHEGDQLIFPYMLHGTAGIGSVLARFTTTPGNEHYRSTVLRLAAAAYVSHSYAPGLFEGLAGIGEFILDAAHCLNEPHFASQAFDVANAILNFRIERGAGLAFPDRSLQRISTDYGAGSAGIGLFFHRLAHGGDRLLLDSVT